MKYILYHFFLLLFSSSTVAQITAVEKELTVKEHANKMGEFFLKQDFISYSEYTHPRIMELMGGKDSLIKALKNGMQILLDEGLEIKSVTYSDPIELLYHNGEVQCIITENLEMTTASGRMIIQSTILGISRNNGKTWYFTNVKGSSHNFKEIFPEVSDELIIPDNSDPIFISE